MLRETIGAQRTNYYFGRTEGRGRFAPKSRYVLYLCRNWLTNKGWGRLKRCQRFERERKKWDWYQIISLSNGFFSDMDPSIRLAKVLAYERIYITLLPTWATPSLNVKWQNKNPTVCKVNQVSHSLEFRMGIGIQFSWGEVYNVKGTLQMWF